MLKALELAGFKSFADKTRFEFPPGITVVVGPNGSGKSNIVDAIKWVLGEQSAKSLRGKDMADVIFKGSGAGGRKMMNTAEATIIFDNSEGRLPVDAPEVHVTRRVYRSGEGEYLINRQPCRLKDIRDMFRGTGVGTDAYSLIEQGKVDRMLQASPKDRRAMFEEAAGISRFKAKKVETQRRLERVQQNLVRLSDIVDEVEGRLRAVRSQASKARRYREYQQRLQELRTQVALTDWRALSQSLAKVEQQLASVRGEYQALHEQSERAEQRSSECEQQMADSAESIRSSEARYAENRERMAGHKAAADHQRLAVDDREQEARRYRQQLAALSGKAGDVQERLQAIIAELKQAETELAERAREVEQHELREHQFSQRLEDLKQATRQRRDLQVQQLRQVTHLSAQVEQAAEAQTAADQDIGKCDSQLQELESSCLSDQEQRDQLADQLAGLQANLRELAEEESAAHVELSELKRLRDRRGEERNVLLSRLAGVQERASLLEQLERRKEGLGSGVREVLTRAATAVSGPFSQVKGLVADLLEVPLEYALLTDIALGEKAQLLVVPNATGLAAWRAIRASLPGRVGLLPLDGLPTTTVATPPDPTRLLGCLARQVKAPPELSGLVDYLLGSTWVVGSLREALELQREGWGLRLVTRDGELLEADGRLALGPRDSGSGLVSRRSELRELHRDARVVQTQIDSAEQELQRLADHLDRRDRQLQRILESRKQQESQQSDLRVSLLTLDDRLGRVRIQLEHLQRQRQAAVDQLTSASQRYAAAQSQLQNAETAVSELERRLQSDDVEGASVEAELRQHRERANRARVERARCEHLAGSLRDQRRRFEEDRLERSRAIEETREQLAVVERRRVAAERRILDATAELALLYLRKEMLADEIVAAIARRDDLQSQRAELADQLHRLRQSQRQLEDRLRKMEVEAGQFRQQRDSLVERIRDDYDLEIGELADQVQHAPAEEREAVESEITQLRKKLGNIGAVNMEALDELDALEERFGSLSGQYQDLVKAKEALERIIHKINADSRRLFTETLEAIRTNFQQLYRKAFGGGKADIVLEEGIDVLEAGVDILATPPGKPSFNNSLLSGGEKALTAVALLLAIFQYRPSPFCVLDEVDAPFDEANIGRFVDVLKDFLGWTKFVIVTHSKKTMTAANTLYGVTMQESGVSKQVSVRFEDVTEDGHIRSEALARAAESPPDDDERAA